MSRDFVKGLALGLALFLAGALVGGWAGVLIGQGDAAFQVITLRRDIQHLAAKEDSLTVCTAPPRTR